MVEPTSPRNRSPYQNNAVALMRNGVLDAMQRLLVERRWSTITMADVAKAAGISRGTLYNEFGTRRGLARNYALRLTHSDCCRSQKILSFRSSFEVPLRP